MIGYEILVGDCREMLRTLPDESVHCVVTSPPYWGLRDYGTASWEGGDPDCAHRVGGQVQDGKAPGAIVAGVRPGVDASRCRDCGAVRVDSQLGLEATPEEYVANMVEVFREVRRVLRDDGTLFLNLGDSYAATGKSGGGAQGEWWEEAGADHTGPRGGKWRPAPAGLKPKDLVGIPWRVAFALQADGWYLRSDIIWHKPNPMPESVQDRPTKAHEYVFLLSKNERYHYDAEAIAEEATCDRKRGPALHPDRVSTNGNSGLARRELADTRNARSVWTITTKPYPGAHFATFPPELAERCILAGCPKGGTVLDPFGGSGTVGMVATGHGRSAVLIELNPEYAEMARQRIGPMFETTIVEVRDAA